jgi:hypothetical protein
VASADGEETGTTDGFAVAPARAKSNDVHDDEADARRRVGADAEEAATEEGFACAQARAKTSRKCALLFSVLRCVRYMWRRLLGAKGDVASGGRTERVLRAGHCCFA